MSKREAERRVGLYAQALSSFFLSTLRNKRSGASETERENENKENCFEKLSILTVLLLHLGHLFFCCHLSCQWQMTQHQTGGSGRPSLRTDSPQAKLVQDLVHLHAPLLPHLSSHSVYTVSNISDILHMAVSLLISFLTSQQHISPSLFDYTCLSCSFSFAVRFNVIENPSLCQGKGEICESMVSQWRRGSLRIVLYKMCQTLKQMCYRKITHC